MVEQTFRGVTKREFLAEQMAEGGLAANVIDGVFTDPQEVEEEI